MRSRRIGVVAGAVIALGLSVCPAYADPEAPPVEAGVAPGTPVPDPRPGEAFADPKVAKLQRTASDVQSELSTLTGRIRQARDELRRATAASAKARATRERADAVVAEQQDEVDEYSSAVFGALGKPDEIRLFLTATNLRDWLDGSGMVADVRADQNRRLTAARERQRVALAAERAAAGAQRSAAARKAALDDRTDDATNRASAVSSELRGEIADANDAVVAQQKAQQKRNGKTARNWQSYVGRLRAAGITPPPAAALRNPAALPAGLEPLPGANGKPQPGVARWTAPDGKRLLVLPKETMDAVSAGVDALGRPYVPAKGGEGPKAYSCDGLTRSAYRGSLPGSAAEQLATGRPVAAADAQPGDLVFVGPKRYGVQSVGIVLDKRTMLVADARRASVVVTDLPAPDSVLGFVRPALGKRPPAPVPQPSDGGLTWRCGSVILPAAASDEAAGAWGGFPNGLIPPASLCPVGAGSHVLRCDAAQAYQAMSAAFAATFGRPLCITDSYRTFQQQVRLYGQKPALAAVPGTSNHGWALAVDLCGGVNSFGTPEYQWMLGNAGAFGWSNPGWARAGNGREEPWHWEYVG